MRLFLYLPPKGYFKNVICVVLHSGYWYDIDKLVYYQRRLISTLQNY